MRAAPDVVNPPTTRGRDNGGTMPTRRQRTSSSRPETAGNALRGWRVMTLRPSGEASALLSALRRQGADAMNLAVVALRGVPSADAASAIARAATARHALFASPAAVRHARRIDRSLKLGFFAHGGPLDRLARAGQLYAPGRGTADALQRAGIARVRIPESRYDSEGVLALPALAPPLSGGFALIGAPHGRGVLDEALVVRGAEVIRVHVYERTDVAPDVAVLDRLVAAKHALAIVSSAAALDRLVATMTPDALAALRDRVHWVLASGRLDEAATRHGFHHRSVARSAHTADLVAAAVHAATHLADTSAKDDSVSMTP